MVMSCEGVFCGRRVGSRDEVSSEEERLSHRSVVICDIGLSMFDVADIG